jgi:hypothetical protein
MTEIHFDDWENKADRRFILIFVRLEVGSESTVKIILAGRSMTQIHLGFG